MDIIDEYVTRLMGAKNEVRFTRILNEIEDEVLYESIAGEYEREWERKYELSYTGALNAEYIRALLTDYEIIREDEVNTIENELQFSGCLNVYRTKGGECIQLRSWSGGDIRLNCFVAQLVKKGVIIPSNSLY